VNILLWVLQVLLAPAFFATGANRADRPSTRRVGKIGDILEHEIGADRK
jgi:hypothetical protein